MSARDRLHSHMRQALVHDGWTITHDPLRLRAGARDLYVDLGAERLLAAQKGTVRIAVEVKGFTGRSLVEDLEQAVGQFVVYGQLLAISEPDRRLYLGVSESAYDGVFQEPLGQLLLIRGVLRLVVCDSLTEEIRKWTHPPSGAL